MKPKSRIANNPPADQASGKNIPSTFGLSLSNELVAENPGEAADLRQLAAAPAIDGVPRAVLMEATEATRVQQIWHDTPAKHRKIPEEVSLPILTLGHEHDALWHPALSPKPFSLDYLDGPLGYRIARAESDSSPLRKALPKSRDTSNKILWDLCGGWRVDALLMAHWHFEVHSFEKSPWVHLITERALHRSKIIAEKELHLQTHRQDALEALDALVFTQASAPSVIYIDPMYPSTETTALNQLEMRFLHYLSSPADISAELLKKSLPIALDRVVIKRPIKTPFTGQAPNFSVEQGSTRYDIYLAER